MKSWKRNALVAAVLVLVCGGIYWNWRYEENRAVDLVSTLDQEKVLDEAKLVLAAPEEGVEAAAQAEPENQTAEQVFAKMRLSRQQSRDSAVHLLQETITEDDIHMLSPGDGFKWDQKELVIGTMREVYIITSIDCCCSFFYNSLKVWNLINSSIIANHHTIETHISTKNILQNLTICHTSDAMNIVITRHHSYATCKTNHRLMRQQDFLHHLLLVSITSATIAKIML